MAAARHVLHVDMDAFYASVEQRDDPSLRGKPLIVGGPSRRGVVLAASYEVRPFGVRSAISMAEAYRLCPHAVVVPPRRERYEEVSRLVFAVFAQYTPLIEGLSLDEAFLDVTASRSLFGEPAAIARRIKDDIQRELGLTASAGVAASKFVAKVASDLEKPDGLVVVKAGDEAAFLAPLPIERMWGVGPKTAPRMRSHGYDTLGTLARARPEDLERLLGSWGRTIHDLARGEDARDVDPSTLGRSIGSEETHEFDLTQKADIERSLLAHAARVAQRLVREGHRARGVSVKLKFADFTVKTRQLVLPDPASDTETLFGAARDLLGRFALVGERVRLTGVTATHLTDDEPAPTLFPDRRAQKRLALEHLVSKVADRFGEGGLTRATLLDPED